MKLLASRNQRTPAPRCPYRTPTYGLRRCLEIHAPVRARHCDVSVYGAQGVDGTGSRVARIVVVDNVNVKVEETCACTRGVRAFVYCGRPDSTTYPNALVSNTLGVGFVAGMSTKQVGLYTS